GDMSTSTPLEAPSGPRARRGTAVATRLPRRTERGQDERGLSRLGLFTVLLGVFLPMTDFFIVNVALPTINRDLHASSGMLQLVVAGYTIAYAVLLVVGGRLGDAIGRRRLFLAGMAGFTLASLACGIAPTVGILVAVRALQGSTAAVMGPQGLST